MAWNLSLDLKLKTLAELQHRVAQNWPKSG
jgi:hypothetical protein